MTLRKRKGPTPTWWMLLNQAVSIIQRERDIGFDSYSDVDGRITDVDERAEIRRYDRFLKAARAELLKKYRV